MRQFSPKPVLNETHESKLHQGIQAQFLTPLQIQTLSASNPSIIPLVKNTKFIAPKSGGKFPVSVIYVALPSFAVNPVAPSSPTLHAPTTSPNVIALERAPTNGIRASTTVQWPSRGGAPLQSGDGAGGDWAPELEGGGGGGGCAGEGSGFGGECGEEDGEDDAEGTACFWRVYENE